MKRILSHLSANVKSQSDPKKLTSGAQSAILYKLISCVPRVHTIKAAGTNIYHLCGSTALTGEADWLGDVLVAGAPQKRRQPRDAHFQEVPKETATEVYVVRIEHSTWDVRALPPSR